MADFEVIQHYLVEIGFDVDQPELQKVVAEIKEVFDQIRELAPPIIKTYLGMVGTIMAGFTAIAGGAIAMMSHVADAELGFQKYALRMNMNLEVAKKTKIGLDALGATLGDLFWNKEIQESFVELYKAQEVMERNLGANYQQNMKHIRDIGLEITKFFKVEMPYFQMALTSSLEQAFGLGDGGLLRLLRQFNDAVMHGMDVNDPNSMVNQLAKVIKPIILDVGDALMYLTKEFIKFGGYLSDNDDLKDGKVTIKNIGLAFEAMVKSVPKVVEYLKAFISPLITIAKIVLPIMAWLGAHPIWAAALLGGAIGGMSAGPYGALAVGGVAAAAAIWAEIKDALDGRDKEAAGEGGKATGKDETTAALERLNDALNKPESKQGEDSGIPETGRFQLDLNEDQEARWKAFRDESRKKDEASWNDSRRKNEESADRILHKQMSYDERRAQEKKDLDARRAELAGKEDAESKAELLSIERYQRYSVPTPKQTPAGDSGGGGGGSASIGSIPKYDLSNSPVMSGGISGESLKEFASGAGSWLSQHADLITGAKNAMGKAENWTKENVKKAVVAAAQRFGVPPEIALGVAKAESNFNINATSGAGAHGVMQLMPGTARQMGVNINDPAQNIAGGVAYLKKMFDQFHDWHLALMAYNWGPGSVQKMLHGRGGAVPAETRAYTQRVESLANIGAINVHAAAGQNPEEIASYVVKIIEDRLNRKYQRNLVQLGGGFYG